MFSRPSTSCTSSASSDCTYSTDTSPQETTDATNPPADQVTQVFHLETSESHRFFFHFPSTADRFQEPSHVYQQPIHRQPLFWLFFLNSNFVHNTVAGLCSRPNTHQQIHLTRSLKDPLDPNSFQPKNYFQQLQSFYLKS